MEQQLFFGPGAVWPVENANHVQIIRAVSVTAAAGGFGAELALRGCINSGLARQQWMDDDDRQLSLDDWAAFNQQLDGLSLTNNAIGMLDEDEAS